MTAGLPLFKTVLATLSKSVLVPLGLTDNSCRNSYDYSKGILWIGQDNIIFFKWRPEWYHKNN